MKKLTFIIVLCFYLTALQSEAQNARLTSPNGNIRFSFTANENGLAYSVMFKSEPLITNARLNLSFLESGSFGQNVKLAKPAYKDAVEKYELIVGKTRSVNERYRELILPLQETVKPFRKVNLVVRAFNDGLAFRYQFPVQQNQRSWSLTQEDTEFRLAGNPRALTLFLPNYTTSHEGEYSLISYEEIKEDKLMDVPTLFQFPGNTWLAITEAALVDYPGMYLSKKDGVLRSMLSPLPDQPAIKAKLTLPHKTPWRVIMISDRIGDLIESNIITNLNEPIKIKDPSWIKPGKTTFPWWNGSIIPDTTFPPGNNFENNKYYIDFCARNGLEYHSVVESVGHEWYVNDGENYQPGEHADVTKPVPGLDMQQICDYAASKGVGIRVWVHWKALYPKIDTAFALFEKWGIKGMMVDFMDRDDQDMTRIKEEILQKAARHKLHIQFHGSEKPTGLSRTYPNEFTREGTLNYEVNKWDKTVTPDHDLNIIFTRMLAGSTDYHMGGFRAVPASLFEVQYLKPLMMGTRCHMLGMYVVLENYQGMVCDYPAAYEGQPGFEFIQRVPTVWDKTIVLHAEVQQYVAIARKKNNEWWVGAITNRDARTLPFNFKFLKEGEWIAEIYTDHPEAAEHPNKLLKETKIIKPTDNITISLAPGGGAAIYLKRSGR